MTNQEFISSNDPFLSVSLQFGVIALQLFIIYSSIRFNFHLLFCLNRLLFVLKFEANFVFTDIHHQKSGFLYLLLLNTFFTQYAQGMPAYLSLQTHY